LTGKGYRQIGRRIAGLKKPTFFVLEGGYQGENIGKDIHQLLKAYET
jgi:acetoin utilization deacetylase AcuC-like enzyme